MADLDYKELWAQMKAVLAFSIGVDWNDKAGFLALMGKLEVMQVSQKQANNLLGDKDIQDAVLGKVKEKK
jgi:DNA-binding ferritin-like protein (Dps family)